MAARVSPTEAIRAEIHELFASGGELLSVVEQVARLSVRLTFQSVIEEIVCEELGRDRYQRRRADSPEGYRNGWHQPRTLKTSPGAGAAAAPQAAPRPRRPVRPAVRPGRQPHQRAGDAGHLLLGAGPVGPRCGGDAGRGLRPAGHDQPLDRQPDLPAAAGRVRRLEPPRPVQGTRIDYLYLDGSFFKMHPKARAEPVLAAWGIDTDGKRCSSAWAGGGRVDRRLARVPRGPGRPGAGRPAAGHLRRRQGAVRGDRVLLPPACTKGVWSTSAATSSPRSPPTPKDQVKRDYWAIFDQIEQDGEAAVAEARRRAKRFIAKWKPLYPAAVACVADNLDALLVHLLFPAEHRQRIRHSNLIERTFGETRRRVKVIGRLPGEQSCLSLVWAVLDRASKGWRGLTMTPKALRRLQDLRRELLVSDHKHQEEEVVAEPVTAAA